MPARPDEFGLIAKYFAPLSGQGSFALKDDATLLEIPKGRKLVVTTDAINERVHFLENTTPALIAQKAIRTNLSDLAAKGAKPFAISMALGLSDAWDRKWIESFSKGLESDCKKFGLSLCGGDTFRSPSGTMVSITAFGHVKKIGYVSRLGAGEGDLVFVSGNIGDSVLGLALEMQNPKSNSKAEAFLRNRYLLPRPRVELASLISKFATASMDISDGLIGDLEKLCAASGKSAIIAFEQIPLSREARNYLKNSNNSLLEDLLTGGDDYELLFTVAQKNVDKMQNAALATGVNVTCIGAVDAGKGVTCLSDGKPVKIARTSYNHFSK